MKIKMLGVVAFSLIAFEGVASAQTTPKKTTSSVEVMIFDDDKVLLTNLSPTDARIGAGHPIHQSVLVRPRVTFAPELIKSIENL